MHCQVTCAAEIPVFFYIGKVMKVTGILLMLHLSLAGFVVRLLCYWVLAWWGSPWWVLPVELLHGITFGCAWAAGTEYSSKIAPAGLEVTAQVMRNWGYEKCRRISKLQQYFVPGVLATPCRVVDVVLL